MWVTGYVSGFLTIKPHGGNTQTYAGSQQETRSLWHPAWLWLSRPAFLISPDYCTCQEEHEGRGSQCTLSLITVRRENPSVICPDKHTLQVGARSQGTCTLQENPWWANPCMNARWTETKMKPNRKLKNGCWSSLFHIFTKIPLEQQCGTLITKMSSVQKNKKDPLQYDWSLDSQGSTYLFIHLLNIGVGEKGARWLALIRRTRQSWWYVRSRDLLHLGLLLVPLKLLEQAWLSWTKLGLGKWQRRLMPFET